MPDIKTRETGSKGIKAIDKAAAQGVLHKNTAARKKSQVAGKFNSAQ